MSFPERMAPLAILIGRWNTTIQMLDERAGPSATSTATDTYGWSANGMFVQHDVDAQMEGERALSLEIIAADPDGDGYVSRSYDSDGSFHDFIVELDGRNWHLTGTEQRFRGCFSDDGQSLAGRWEGRGVEDSWTPLMDVTLRKQAD